ncbi:MAG: hypothetical protein ACYC1U_06850 [Candidatus Aquicultorales bacterium]
MIDDFDRADIRGAVTEIIADEGRWIEIVRGDVKLLPQKVRIVRASRAKAQERRSDAGELLTAEYLIVGEVGLDIAPKDRLVVDGEVLEVIYVDPHSSIQRVAEAISRG